jgi:hypothetical protein
VTAPLDKEMTVVWSQQILLVAVAAVLGLLETAEKVATG